MCLFLTKDLPSLLNEMKLLFQHESEGETVFEFPTYIKECFQGVLWDKDDTKFHGGKFGGVLLKVMFYFLV